MRERRKRSTVAQAARWLSSLSALPIEVDEEAAARAWSDVLALAGTQGLSAYAAAYQELAVRRGLSLATLDKKLNAAAADIGVEVFAP